MNIGYLSKVSLSLKAGQTGSGAEDGLGEKQFDFVYGIGSDGLTPLESVLQGRQENDELTLEIKENDSHHIFQHLWFPELDALFHSGSPLLIITIMSVSKAAPRDVIRALAEIARCGDDNCCGH